MIDEIKKSLEEFLKGWASAEKGFLDVCIYNEFSFQFELGKYLHKRFPEYKVQFERNISDFFINEADYDGRNDQLKQDRAEIKKPFYKREIDIVIFKGENPWDTDKKYAVELKYIMPSDNIDRAYELLEDIAFTQQLVNIDNFKSKTDNEKRQPFNGAIAVTICNRSAFWTLSTRNVKPETTGATIHRYEVFRTDKSGSVAVLDREQVYRREYGKKSKKQSYKDIIVKPCEVKWEKLDNFKEGFRYYMVISRNI